MSVAEFNRIFTVKQAIGYLGQIERVLKKEALDDSEEGYFYTGLRHVFAEIDGMGKLYQGERGTGNTTENAIAFGTEYLGRINPCYKCLYGLLVDMYRHGLAHTHLTKSIKFRGARNRWITVGWAMSDEKGHRHRHLTIEQREARYFRLWLNVPQLVEDTLKALAAYRSDLQRAGDNSPLFRRFKVGYIGTAAVFQEPSPLSSVGTPLKKRTRKHPLVLKSYSADGIAWIQKKTSSGSAWRQ
jgi:hypothetical protein